MFGNAKTLVLIGHATLLLALPVCYLIVPHYFNGSGGLSNYGADVRTVVPFTLGFGAAGICSIMAARCYKKRESLRKPLLLLGILYIVVLVSTYPYQLNDFLDTIHKIAGLLLLVFQAAFGLWLAFVYKRSVIHILLAGTVLFGLWIVAVAFLTPSELLSHGQALAAFAFATLLISVIPSE